MRRLPYACVALLPALLATGACPEPEPEPIAPPAFVLPDAYAEGAGRREPGLVGLPNIDDDNGDGERDWSEPAGAAENDFVSFAIDPSSWDGLAEGEGLRLEMTHGTGQVRVRDAAGTVVLGEAPGENLWDLPVHRPESGDAVEFSLEFKNFLARAGLALRQVDAAGELIGEELLFVTASPLLLNHHGQQNERTFALEADWGGQYNNLEMLAEYEEVLGDGFERIPGAPYAGDVWVQDEFQIAFAEAPGQRLDVVLDLIRDRGLDEFPEDELQGPDFALLTWGDPDFVSSLDYGGNLEISMPLGLSGGAGESPFGRFYFGGDAATHPARELTDFFAAEQVQDPFMPDTTWLCVGHIDEYTSFVPDPTAPRGFRFVITDTQAAWDVILGLDPSTELGRFGGTPPWEGHGLPDVASFLDNDALRMLNEEVQEDHVDPALELFRAELDLQEEEILRMPGLWEEPFGCDQWVAALIPGMTNLIVTQIGEQKDVFLADPYFRPGDDPRVSEEHDPLIQAVRAAMPGDLELHFVDDWFVYHLGLGEVHCGTNEIETPAAHWWEIGGLELGEAP
jgi:protein-arginine deiminase